MTTAIRTLTGPRWSSAVMCARQSVYQGLGTEGTKPTPEQERVFRRGRFIGEAIARDVVETFKADEVDVIPEQEVPWPAADPIGVGHADLYIPSEAHVIEVVSRRDCELPGYKVLQVAGYAVNLGATKATVLSIDPTTYAERAYPVNIASMAPRVREIEAKVHRGMRIGDMPERAGAHPGDFPCFWCAFKDTCWQGVELPEAGRLENDHHVALLQRLADIEDAIPQYANREKELKAERDQIRDELTPHIEPGRETFAQGIRVKVTPVAGRQSLNMTAAAAAGHALPDNLQPFVTEGKGYLRWTIKRVGGGGR
ncbi:MAG TPA: hypothetical protein VJP59_03375 [Gemmatimonadota bacterium]|nr:hypothetical protein [Gemmatimonadota bacterium]